MSIVKLSEILNSKKGIDLNFVSLTTDETRGGLPIVRLILKENIPIVYGRQITDNVTQDRVRLQATDVEMVSIGKDALDAIEELEAAGTQVFTWDRVGESGNIKCNLKLDVSNNLEVWISKDGFAKFAADRRSERTSQRRSSLVQKIRDAKTKQELGSVVVDASGAAVKAEPVATEATN